jgi:tRNA(Ile)-lysidine synthase
MIDSGNLVLVAVSGGPDSVALMHALHTLAGDLRFRLLVAHFNHELRGSESRLDEEFVVEMANSLALPVEVGSAGDRLRQRPREVSLEEAARRLRYEFLEAAARRLGAQKVATAHTMDDQAETVLMRIVQGTGPGGLAGIRPVREGFIIRPLLQCRSREVADFLREIRVAARIDASNRDPAFLRNRIRHDLLPILEKDFNPKIVEALTRISSVEREVDRYLRVRAENALEECAEWSAGKMRLALDRFGDYDIALQSYILRAAIGEMLGELTDISFKHLQLLLDLTRREDTPFKQVSLPGSLVAYRDRGGLVLTRDEPHGEARSETISVPGVTSLRTSFPAGPAPGRLGTVNSGEALFDWDTVRPPLQVRCWRPGDRFRPAGMRGSKKIQDFFVDEKVPRWIRHRTPLLVDRGAVHWIIGYRTSELSKVRDCTTRVLRVEAIPSTE